MQGGLKKTRAKKLNCVALIQISGTVERRGRRKEKELSLLRLRVDKRRTRKEYFKQYSVPKSRHHFHRGAQGHCAVMLCKHQRPLSLSLSLHHVLACFLSSPIIIPGAFLLACCPAPSDPFARFATIVTFAFFPSLFMLAAP